jgi:hypothetical protein
MRHPQLKKRTPTKYPKKLAAFRALAILRTAMAVRGDMKKGLNKAALGRTAHV